MLVLKCYLSLYLFFYIISDGFVDLMLLYVREINNVIIYFYWNLVIFCLKRWNYFFLEW